MAALLMALSSPANFRAGLEVAINELRGRMADLEADIAPVQHELDKVNRELRRLTVGWIRDDLTDDEVDGLRRSALERREHLTARLEALGPGRLEELERTRSLLSTVEGELAAADTPGWWAADTVWRRMLPPEMLHVLADRPMEGVEPGEVAFEAVVEQPDKLLRHLLTRLQAEVWSAPDGISIRGMIEVSVCRNQEYNSTSKNARLAAGTRPPLAMTR